MKSLSGRTVVVSTTVLLLLLLLGDATTNANDNKDMVVKVFILAGQSNMVGMASIEHLTELIVNNATTTTTASSSSSSSSPPPPLQRDNDHVDYEGCNATEYCKDLWDVKTNSFKIRQNVFIKYNNVYGNLTVGHGFAADHRFGPELGFGWVLGGGNDDDDNNAHNHDNIIYIIKAAWGGRSLAVDFRPPASGEGDYENVKPHVYGWEYREMINSINDGLDQIANVVPGYNNNNNSNTTSSFEIAGFVWFQGWNDMISMPFVMEYGYNLMNFMRDVRKELNSPQSNLPIVVGELGMHGAHYQGQGADRVLRMRAAQKAVTLLPDFINSSQFVPTTPYVVLNTTDKYGGIYHYNGRADTYYHIGKAFGRAMLKLLAKNESMTKQQSSSSSASSLLLS